MKTIGKEHAALASRLEEVESIVDQLNDTSTQPNSRDDAPTASTTEIRK